ncbi:MAG: hypothetical protein ACK4GM_14480 [Tabrizicola sp.]
MAWRRVRLNAYGGPEELEIETVADLPAPGAGEVRIRVLVTSAAFTDVMIRKGMYPDVKESPPSPPATTWWGSSMPRGPERSGSGRATAWPT